MDAVGWTPRSWKTGPKSVIGADRVYDKKQKPYRNHHDHNDYSNKNHDYKQTDKSHHYDHEDYSSQNHYDKQAHKNHHGHYDVFAIRCVCLGGGVDPPWMQYRSKQFRKNHGHAVCAVALPLALRTRAHLPSDRPDLKPT